ncbi:MAG: C4-dicarboxylate ABC transporter substrate-binding protein, partial [Rhodobacteraceae bacterium]|nr:C4-dicarboxylate ABC transporter substrate-binding protein [Paracoccaceae bacterium]
FSPYTLLMNRAVWDGLTEEQQDVVRYAAKSCVTASRGLSRIIEASDRGLAGLREKMTVTALTPEERNAMREATQPVFEAYVAENLDEKAVELLELFKTEVDKANATPYIE